MKNPNKPVRRCKCHKAPIGAEFDDKGNFLNRYCVVTLEELLSHQVYMATAGSADEVSVDPGPDVQRGASLND